MYRQDLGPQFWTKSPSEWTRAKKKEKDYAQWTPVLKITNMRNIQAEKLKRLVTTDKLLKWGLRIDIGFYNEEIKGDFQCMFLAKW